AIGWALYRLGFPLAIAYFTLLGIILRRTWKAARRIRDPQDKAIAYAFLGWVFVQFGRSPFQNTLLDFTGFGLVLTAFDLAVLSIICRLGAEESVAVRN